MRNLPALIALLGVCAIPAAGRATPAERNAHMDAYLSIWSRNATITPAIVHRLYARRVDYYGHAMSAEAVYRDKVAFIRRWPSRRYAAVPGSVTNDCQEASAHCRVSALLRWSRGSGSGLQQSGTNSIRLDLARDDGSLKIVRERGKPVSER